MTFLLIQRPLYHDLDPTVLVRVLQVKVMLFLIIKYHGMIKILWMKTIFSYKNIQIEGLKGIFHDFNLVVA